MYEGIDVDAMMEINIVDTAKYVARLDAPGKRFWDYTIGSIIFAVLALAIIGFIAVVRWIF